MPEPEPKPSAAAQDAALLERVAARDTAALAELYDRYASMLFALSRRILTNQLEAEDVLQDVFLQVWNQAGRYQRSRSSVSTWLVLIARSRAIDRLRTRKVVTRTAEAAHRESPVGDTSSGGAGRVLNREQKARIGEELARLPTEQREVLELAFYRGLTQAEIAYETATPLGTVKTRTLLAMRKLREALAEEIEELL
jgi:RNA polymerase sigma-70 factor (ECF subfamily)